jgi:hypothetical protein
MLTTERLLHPATIVATIALLVALGGAAYSAATIGSADIRNGAVTGPKIARNAVTGPKIAPGAVGRRDLARAAVSSGKIAPAAVGAGALGTGAVTPGKLAPNAVTGATLANGSVTTDKLGPNAVTGAKIAGATITGANIQNGQVVKGNGNLLSARVVVPAGAVNATVLALPGIGLIRASCPAATASTNVLNQSGSAADVTAAGVNDDGSPPTGTAVFERSVVASGTASPTLTSGGGGAIAWRIAYADAAGVAHVASAWVAVGLDATDCVVSAQGLTTG